MSPDRIAVAIAGEERHLFDSIQDARVEIVRGADQQRADLVVFPCSRHRRFDNIDALTLPADLRAAIETRRAGLVFDTSLEGVGHKPDITAALHATIGQLGGTTGQSVYVTQDRQYQSDYQQYCASNGLTPVSVLTHDYWIWYALNEFQANGAEVFRQRLEAFRGRPAARPRKFVCLNRTPRPTKVLFLLRLLRDGLWDDGYVSFGGFRRQGSRPGKDRPTVADLQRALPGFEDLVAELAPWLDHLDGLGRVLLGLERHGWKNIDLGQASMASDLAEYDQSWFTVITETEMRPRPSRVTEKVIKPLVNFQPLLVFGNPGALKMIRDFGFATFDGLFDESYDDVLDPRQRFERVYEQVVRACGWSDAEWRQAENRIEDTLVLNAKWGLTEFPSAYRRRHDVMLVDRILAATRDHA